MVQGWYAFIRGLNDEFVFVSIVCGWGAFVRKILAMSLCWLPEAFELGVRFVGRVLGWCAFRMVPGARLMCRFLLFGMGGVVV